MKASSFLKTDVNHKIKIILKKTYTYYIYNIIKRNTQGLVSSFRHLLRYCGNTITKEANDEKVRSRDKAGMKASSFLKNGVRDLREICYSKKHMFTIYI